ncbi:MAG: tetratricopeptide repeat protein [Ignavibacteriales bacterium]|nr:tetratricopeptide repeat protein [Ignavibacteriales bacterium]
MLGNYHFLNGNYSFALQELENSYKKFPNNLCAKKRLIICYTQTKNIDKALDLFTSLIKENIDCIIDTKPEEEDCPCADLVVKIESGKAERYNQYELFIELGILWLYCDINQSLSYFTKAYQVNQNEMRLEQIIQILTSKINEQHQGERNGK